MAMDKLQRLSLTRPMCRSRLTDGWSEVKRAAVAAGIANDNALAQETALVMGYHLRMALGSEVAACRLGPATPADEHSWPPTIENVSADVVRLWSDAADHVTKTCSIARIHDLLFERREGNSWVHAQAAILAYLDFAATAHSELDRTEVLMRAWDSAVVLEPQTFTLGAGNRWPIGCEPS